MCSGVGALVRVVTSISSLILTVIASASPIVIDKNFPAETHAESLVFVDPTRALQASEVAQRTSEFSDQESQGPGSKWHLWTFENRNTGYAEIAHWPRSGEDCVAHHIDSSRRVLWSASIQNSPFNAWAWSTPTLPSDPGVQSRYQSLEIPPGESASLLVECKDGSEPRFTFWDIRKTLEWSRGRIYIEGLLTGAILFMALVAVASSYVNRDSLGIVYALWLIMIAVTQVLYRSDGSRLEEFVLTEPIQVGVLIDSWPQYFGDWASAFFLLFCCLSLIKGQSFQSASSFGRAIDSLSKLGVWTFIGLLSLQGVLELLTRGLSLSGVDAPPQTVIQLFGITRVVFSFLLSALVLLIGFTHLRSRAPSDRFVIFAIFLNFVAFPGVALLRPLLSDVNLLYLNTNPAITVWAVYVLIGLTMAFAVIIRNREVELALERQTEEHRRLVEGQNAILEQRVRERTRELEVQTEKTERLMLNILPAAIAERLKRGEPGISDSHASVSILFSDLAGFTALSSERSAAEVVTLLNDLFSRFDRRAQSLGLEKIKTIGDAYMVAGGIPQSDDRHASLVTHMAIGMFVDLQEFNELHQLSVQMRIGINSGSVIAGVIGHTKFSYDLWGSTVNAASRMESTGEAGKIQISSSTYELVRDDFLTRERGMIECKGIGLMQTYFVEGLRQ
ncbi:MAG: hypothetical protein RLY30_1397 [Pseudomonadota bacterium]|jgi:class 3 adenylate cyclase